MNVKTTEVKNENVERTVKTTEVNKLLIELQNYIERTVKTKEVNKLLIELQNYIERCGNGNYKVMKN